MTATGFTSALFIPASGSWFGNDGPWSTFTLGFGTPVQDINTFISFTSTQPWIGLQEVCNNGSEDSTLSECEESRGGIFSPNKSTTWEERDWYKLGASEILDAPETGYYFRDTIILSTLSGNKSVEVSKQNTAGITAEQPFISTWGIAPYFISPWTQFAPFGSLLIDLRNDTKIPSLSFGFTAGAHHMSNTSNNSFASLTLGGYDEARFENLSNTFPFAEDQKRNMVVSLQTISLSGSSETPNLLSTTLDAVIDPGVPHMWLNEETCNTFEEKFSLQYNKDLDLYLIDSEEHESLMQENPAITFHLSASYAPHATNIDSYLSDATIKIPYAAFAQTLTADYPGIGSDTLYFPLRRAANDTEYTLGRVFLQHAYIIADFERRVFSVHQAAFPDGPAEHTASSPPSSIKSIAPPDPDWTDGINPTATTATATTSTTTTPTTGTTTPWSTFVPYRLHPDDDDNNSNNNTWVLKVVIPVVVCFVIVIVICIVVKRCSTARRVAEESRGTAAVIRASLGPYGEVVEVDRSRVAQTRVQDSDGGTNRMSRGERVGVSNRIGVNRQPEELNGISPPPYDEHREDVRIDEATEDALRRP